MAWGCFAVTAATADTQIGPPTSTEQSHQDTPGIPGSSQPNDYFGGAVAWGDFNGDGIDDFAISVPFEDSGEGLDTS